MVIEERAIEERHMVIGELLHLQRIVDRPRAHSFSGGPLLVEGTPTYRKTVSKPALLVTP